MRGLTDYLKSELASATEERIISYLISLVDGKDESYTLEPQLNISDNSNYKADIYFPKGIRALDVVSPLMIEIKGGLLISTFSRELSKGEAYINKFPNSRYWVIYSHTSVNVPDTNIDGVEFKSFDEVVYLAKKPYKKKTTKWVPRKQDDILSEAAKSLNSTKCSFILGAGVSVDAGSPSWNNLLKALLNEIPQHNPITDTDYDHINSKCGYSALITARYILDNYLSSKILIEKMRKIIYTATKCTYKNNPAALTYIAKITKHSNVESILTFNYDEFVEEALDKEGIRYVPFFEKGAPAADEKPVYHIHGYISRNTGGLSSFPVLSEREYHRLYSDDFHWSNVELLHALTRNTCFLVGLSMSDPNLRRLLDIARYNDSGIARHYIFMRREPLNPNVPNSVKDKKHWENVERQFSELGLNVIWFNYNASDPSDFTDLVRKLAAIIGRTGTITI